MENVGPREVVVTWAIHQRANITSGISASAIGSDDTVYLGTLDGQVEEHRLVRSNVGSRLKLVARRHISKKPILDLHFVDSIPTLVALTDGIIRFLNPDTFEGAALSTVRDVTAIDVRKGQAVHMVVAQRMSASGVRFSVLAISSSANGRGLEPQQLLFMDFAEKASVKDVKWMGNKVLFRTNLGYAFFLPRARGIQSLMQLQDDAISRTRFLHLVSQQQALILSDQVGLVINLDGQPIGNPLTFPSSPETFAVIGQYIVAVCGSELLVYDLQSRATVQRLIIPSGQIDEGQEALFVEHNPSRSKFLLVSRQRVWLFEVSALQDQLKQLLKLGDFSAAREVVEKARETGLPWAEYGLAQLGLLMLEDLRVEEAMELLLQCHESVFHPMQLFTLFPEVTKLWQSDVEAKKYWGMHEPLESLEKMLARHRYLSATDLKSMEARAEKAIVNYLLQVRENVHSDLLNGIDTLIVSLLSRQQMTGALVRFVRGPNFAEVRVVEETLKARGDLNALAFLYANWGRPEDALEIWKGFVEQADASRSRASGDGSEDAAPSSSNRDDALHNVVELVKMQDLIDDSDAMSFLAWLLKVSPDHVLEIIKGRRLSHDEVLALLRDSSKPGIVRAVLEHYVWDCKREDLHTALATELVDEIKSELPDLDPRVSPRQQAEQLLQNPRLATLRGELRRLLSESEHYDKVLLAKQLADTDLVEEQVIVAEKAGDIRAALEMLALRLEQPGRAEALCNRVGKQWYVTLMEILLQSKAGQPPLYRDACRLLSSHGAELDPMQVLETLSDDMPLANAANILSSMLCERLHRRRQGLLNRNLRRAVHFSATADRVAEMQKFVVVEEDRRCHCCHLPLGRKLFVVFPDGRLMCYVCAEKAGLQQAS